MRGSVSLARSLMGLISDMVVGWGVPLVGIALITPLLGVIIAANNLIGGIITTLIALLITVRAIINQQYWQAICLSMGIPYGLLAFVSPHWAILWGMLITTAALAVLLIPGVIVSEWRAGVINVIVAMLLVFTIMSGSIALKIHIYPLLLGIILIGAGSLMFSHAARPWEIRMLRRRAAAKIITLATIIILVTLLNPLKRILEENKYISEMMRFLGW